MMVSAERVLEYTQLPQEAAWILGPRHPQKDAQTPRGSLRFTNLQLRYRAGLQLALKNITCDVRSQEKVGVVVSVPSQDDANCAFHLTELSLCLPSTSSLALANLTPGSHWRRKVLDGGRSVPTDRCVRSSQ